MENDFLLMQLLDQGLAHCKVVLNDQGGLLFSLFMAGLVGGLTHCMGMCGPFVLSQVAARLEAVPAKNMKEWHRLTGAAVIPYHLGRLTTYVFLGMLAALVTSAAVSIPGLRWLSVALLLLAAVLFLGYAIPRIKIPLPVIKAAEAWWRDHMGRLAGPLFQAPVGWRGYVLGVVLGFIPCGLVYAALAAAAAPGDPLTGAMAMGSFALGTIPALVAVGWLGHLAGQSWRGVVQKVAPVLLILNAGILAYMAITLI